MANMSDLSAVVAALTLSVTSASAAQAGALTRKNQRLARLNVQAGSVVGSTVVTGLANTQFDLLLNYVPGASRVSALQFDLIIPAEFTIVSATPGPVATEAAKSVSFNATNGRFLVFGINQNPIKEGVLMTVRLGSASGIAKRLYPIGISNVAASDPEGNETVISGISGPVKIQ